MKVLVATTIGRTIDAFLRPQVVELARRGHGVELLACDLDPIADLADRSLRAPWSRPLRLAAVPGAVRRTRRLLTSEGADVLYTHTAIASTITRLASIGLRGRPRIAYCAHGFAGARAQPAHRRIPARVAERLLAPLTDLVIVMNDEDETWARTARFGRVVRIPSVGLDLTHYAPLPEPDRLDRLVVVAELIDRKRVDIAIAAFAQLDERFHLTVVGDGPRRGDLERLATNLGCAARVSFAGQVTDVRTAFAGAAALITTSRQEGLQRSVLEAMACGLPVVGLDARGVTDALRGGGGVIVAGADPGALAAEITRLCTDRSAWEGQRTSSLVAVTTHEVGAITRTVIDALELLG